MIIVIMGVSGCGKTTIGQQLADRLGWPFFDGDAFHPPANIDKMSRGIPLNDEDRAGWLDAIADRMRELLAVGQSSVFACSALKQKYRDQLQMFDQVKFVYLRGDYDLIWSRMQQRPGHYMKPNMLASQFEALEEPRDALTLDIGQPPDQMVEHIIQTLIGK
ncbi:MAG: gluconokinase [Thermoflexales bacterium]|nr:gluconokinase [Thermoflexales bacterium]